MKTKEQIAREFVESWYGVDEVLACADLEDDSCTRLERRVLTLLTEFERTQFERETRLAPELLEALKNAYKALTGTNWTPEARRDGIVTGPICVVIANAEEHTQEAICETCKATIWFQYGRMDYSMNLKLCPPGEHLYAKKQTSIGMIYFCTRCINWTRKTPAKTVRPASFVPGRKRR